MVKKSKAACCQCFRCSDLCPRNLIGHDLFPHKTMRTIDYGLSNPTGHITSAFLCSQCGVCELIACDVMQLSPRKAYAEYRKLLMEKGIKNPHRKTGISSREELEYRKIPMDTIIKKVGISAYNVSLPSTGYQDITKVRISLNRHTGAVSIPIVSEGDKVHQGDVIAVIPEGKLGAVYHASIKGEIIEVNEKWIKIENNGVEL